MSSRRRRQRGQSLLLVLVFLAAFLLLIWAALRLASGAFLRQASVQADTRETYALDAGVAYALQYARSVGPLCGPFNPPAFTLNYPTGNVTVTVTMTAPATCTAANPVSDVRVSATGISRIVRAELVQNPPGGAGNPWMVRWQAYQ
ncbi:MAG TPA: hypothetical protein VN913_04530 [Candidatus Binatus sp.]|jgi:hypothetical protein|nr:hypothetical protein [Candidatus Binatus sp.]